MRETVILRLRARQRYIRICDPLARAHILIFVSGICRHAHISFVSVNQAKNRCRARRGVRGAVVNLGDGIEGHLGFLLVDGALSRGSFRYGIVPRLITAKSYACVVHGLARTGILVGVDGIGRDAYLAIVDILNSHKSA